MCFQVLKKWNDNIVTGVWNGGFTFPDMQEPPVLEIMRTSLPSLSETAQIMPKAKVPQKYLEPTEAWLHL